MQIYSHKSIKNNTFTSLQQKVDWELRFWLKKSTFRAKQSTFFFGVVRYFFYRHPERIPKELRGIYSFSFLTVPCRHFFSKFSPFFLHVSILLPNYTIATIYMWSIPHLVDLQIENIRRFAFHVFFALSGGSHVCCSRWGCAIRLFSYPFVNRTRRNHPLSLILLQSFALDVVKHDALTAHLACCGAKCREWDVTLGACVKDWRGPAFQLVKFCTFGKHFFVLYIF